MLSKNALQELRKLSGLVNLNERAEWKLPVAEAFDPDGKVQAVSTKLKAHAETLMMIARDLALKSGTPMEFYTVAGDLLIAYSEMLKTSGDKDLGKPLKSVAGKLSSYAAANTHTNTWHAVPTGESLGEAAGRWKTTVLTAMARAMFVSAWADAEEEKGNTYPGKDLMDVAPQTSQDAKQHAEKLARQFEQQNKMSIDELLSKAAKADGDETVDADYASDFGHYVAMQALGHGVSWFDDHEEFPLKIPHTEFYL